MTGSKQKGHNLLLNSRTNVGKNSGIPAKRRGVKVEEPVETLSLEDRIRALTIFEDEEVGLSLSRHSKNPDKVLDNGTLSPEKTTISKHLWDTKATSRNTNFENGSDYESGYYKDLPVAKDSGKLSNSPEKELYYIQGKNGTRNSCDHTSSYDDEVFSPPVEKNGRQWKNYTQVLEDSAVSDHKIDMAVRQEMAGFEAGNVTHQLSSPASNRNQMYDYSQNNGRAISAPVMGEFGHFQSGQRGQDRGSYSSPHGPGDGYSLPGSNNRSFDSTGRAHSSNGVYSLRSTQDYQVEYQSHGSGQLSGSMLPYQEHPGHMQHQDQQHQDQQHQDQQHQDQQHQSWPDQARPHEEAYSSRGHYYTNSQPLPSNKAINPESPFQPTATPSYCIAVSHAQASRGRASWQPWSSFEQQQFEKSHHPNFMEQNNSYIHLETTPSLERASSELCLQESRKHIFASSADINKLFSGQKKRTASSHSPVPGHYQDGAQEQSFNSSVQSHGTLSPEAGQEFSKPKLWVMAQAIPAAAGLSTTSIRADHNVHMPNDVWTNVVPHPNSAQSDRFLPHNHSLSSHADTHISSVQRSPLAGADLSMDRSQLPSLTSGYSSESELQQIEFNAEAIKKFSKFKKMDNSRNTPIHEFSPLDRSTDEDSSVETDTVYDNQSMSTHSLPYDPMNRHNNYVWPPNTVTHGQQRYSPPESGYSEAPPYKPELKSQHPPQAMMYTPSFNNDQNSLHAINNIKTYNINSHSDLMKSAIPLKHKQGAIESHWTSLPNTILEYDINTRNLNKETSQEYLITHYPPQHIHSLHNLPESNRNDDHYNPTQLFSNFEHYIPDNEETHLPHSYHDYHPHETNGYNYTQLSPVEIVRMLDVPFETTIISGTEGDRLSTLV